MTVDTIDVLDEKAAIISELQPTYTAPSPMSAERVLQLLGPDVDDDEEDSHHNRVCRNCHDDDHQEDLIAPCSCAGSVKWVHRKCLDEWRAVSKNPSSFGQCDTCGTYYQIEKRPSFNKTKAWLLFFLRVALDFFLFALTFMVLVWIVGFIPYVSGLDASYLPPTLTGFGLYTVGGFPAFFFLVGVISIVLAVTYCCYYLCCRGMCTDMCFDTAMTADHYPYHSYFSCWYICCAPYRPPVVVVSPGATYSSASSSSACCNNLCLGLGPCDCHCNDCNCSGGNSDGAIGILLFIVVVIILIGVIVSVLFTFVVLGSLYLRRVSVLKNRLAAQEDYVKDLAANDYNV